MQDHDKKDLLIRQGESNFEKEDYDQAIEDFKEVTRLDPKDGYARYMLAESKAGKAFEGDDLNFYLTFGFPEMIKDYSMAFALDRELTIALIGAAYAMSRRDFHNPGAIQLLYEAIENTSDDAILSLAYQRLGDSFQAIGDVERARAAYAMAASLK